MENNLEETDTVFEPLFVLMKDIHYVYNKYAEDDCSPSKEETIKLKECMEVLKTDLTKIKDRMLAIYNAH